MSLEPQNTFQDRLRLLVALSFDRQLDACYHWHIASVTQLKKYLAGMNLPGAGVLTRIALFGYNLNWLLTGSGSMFDQTEAGRVRKVEVLHRLTERGLPDALKGWSSLPAELEAATAWPSTPTVEADGTPAANRTPAKADTYADAGASSVSSQESAVTTPGKGRKRGRTSGPSTVK